MLLSLGSSIASASCGSAFCSINTEWNAQAPWLGNAAHLDLRMEYIHQNKIRSGTKKSIDGGHHQEVETFNRNAWLGLSHAFTPSLNVSIQIPVVSREHQHIHHHHGVPLQERWDFTQMGDARLLAHVRLDDTPLPSGKMYGLLVGIKLPTGSASERNNDGDKAEATLQPGTGSTDLIAGGFAAARLGHLDWHTQLRWQRAVETRQSYRPGDQAGWDMGLRYPLGAIDVLAQINMLWRGRDSGAAAEQDDSGGKFIYISPGLSFSFDRDKQIYALVQLPLYQNVQGTQLTADWAATLGLNVRF